ncbi:unnamed protein product [Cunninghamella blakesleeana]
MIFITKANKHHVKLFKLNVTTGSQDKPIAFGPGSVVNGNVVIQVSKLQKVKRLIVLFECKEYSGKLANTIFSVESKILDESIQVTELNPGNHMYLFAIKLPENNYPPTLYDNYLDLKVTYTLQAYLDLNTRDQPLTTPPKHILYLPLVSYQPTSDSPIERKKVYQNGDAFIQIDAKLMKPAYCPGDKCSIKLITQNRSDLKITHVEVAFLSTMVSHFANSQSQGFRKNHTLHTEKIYVAINPRTNDNHTLLQFKIPSSCVPSTQSQRHIDISYQIMITVPLYNHPHSSSSSASSSPAITNRLQPSSSSISLTSPSSSSSSKSIASSLMISLPISIVTVPYNNTPLPPQILIPLPSYQDSQYTHHHHNNNNGLGSSDMPCFLNDHSSGGESPLPSPRSIISVEGTGSWSDPDRCSVSPLLEDSNFDWPVIPPTTTTSSSSSPNGATLISPLNNNNNNNNGTLHQDQTGHLMVPPSNNNDRRRRSLSMNSTTSSTSSIVQVIN